MRPYVIPSPHVCRLLQPILPPCPSDRRHGPFGQGAEQKSMAESRVEFDLGGVADVTAGGGDPGPGRYPQGIRSLIDGQDISAILDVRELPEVFIAVAGDKHKFQLRMGGQGGDVLSDVSALRGAGDRDVARGYACGEEAIDLPADASCVVAGVDIAGSEFADDGEARGLECPDDLRVRYPSVVGMDVVQCVFFQKAIVEEKQNPRLLLRAGGADQAPKQEYGKDKPEACGRH